MSRTHIGPVALRVSSLSTAIRTWYILEPWGARPGPPSGAQACSRVPSPVCPPHASCCPPALLTSWVFVSGRPSTSSPSPLTSLSHSLLVTPSTPPPPSPLRPLPPFPLPHRACGRRASQRPGRLHPSARRPSAIARRLSPGPVHQGPRPPSPPFLISSLSREHSGPVLQLGIHPRHLSPWRRTFSTPRTLLHASSPHDVALCVV